jgi:CheY-like chemotaxis protein
MTNGILCVDDEPRILEAFERQLRKQFDVRTALGSEKGMQAIAEQGPFAVVVSDLRMPGMNGLEFLSRVRQTSPDTVRIMLTGDADLNAAMTAVNEGNVFQFLTKPCPGDRLTRALDAALAQHRLITAERELLENTLRGSIGVLSEILSLVNPPAFGRAQRIRRYVLHMAERMNLSDPWQYELAAMLSQIGCVTVPPEILDKCYTGKQLSKQEQEILSSQTKIGHDLLVKIPRLEDVAQMVAQQRASWSDMQSDSGPVTTGAHLLRVAVDLDERVMRGNPVELVLFEMRNDPSYNPTFVEALQQLQIEEAKNEVRGIPLSQLKARMVVNAGIYAKTGVLLLAQGQVITESAIARLRAFAKLFGVVEPISVIIPAALRKKEAPETGRIQ